MDFDCLLDLSALSKKDDISNNKKNKDNYNKFNKLTTETYRVMRELHIDPITHDKVPEELAFKFEYMWDPITGERLEKDIYGPLYFNVLSLAKNIYYNRYRLLWNPPEIVNYITYGGYYGDGLLAGDDLYIQSRGIHKHMHPFRLPIIDCYLEKDFNMSIITMGPLLYDDEIKEIQDKINKYYSNKKYNVKHNNINLILIKKLYDRAINKNNNYHDACNAVDELKNMNYKFT